MAERSVDAADKESICLFPGFWQKVECLLHVDVLASRVLLLGGLKLSFGHDHVLDLQHSAVSSSNLSVIDVVVSHRSPFSCPMTHRKYRIWQEA